MMLYGQTKKNIITLLYSSKALSMFLKWATSETSYLLRTLMTTKRFFFKSSTTTDSSTFVRIHTSQSERHRAAGRSNVVAISRPDMPKPTATSLKMTRAAIFIIELLYTTSAAYLLEVHTGHHNFLIWNEGNNW